MKKSILFFWIFMLVSVAWPRSNATQLYGYQAHDSQNGGEPLRVWKSFPVPPTIEDVAFEGNYAWAATQNGVIRWNLQDHTYAIFTTDDGLANNMVLSVAIDTQGNKWFGTQSGGVSKFDGSTWTTYTTADGLPSNTITTIALHPNGTLLMGALSTVTIFDGNTFSFLPPGGPSYPISAIAVDNNLNIWVGTYTSGTYKFNGTTWQIYGDPNTGPGGIVQDITVSPTGDIWFAFSSSFFNGSIGRFSGNTWTRYTMADGLLSHDAYSIDIDSYGQPWAGFSQPNGVAIFNGSSWIPATVPLFSFGITTIRSDNLGKMGVVNGNQFMVFTGTGWEIYLTGLPIFSLLDGPKIVIAANGDIWFGVYRIGVIKYDGSTWRLYSEADGLYSKVFGDGIVDHAGNIWFPVWHDGGNGNGVVRFDGTSWTHFTVGTGLPSHIVYSIAVDGNNNVWFGTHEGVAKYDGINWETFTTDDGLAANWVPEVGAHGTDVWVSYYGLSIVGHFDGSNWENFSTSDGLPPGAVSAFDFDSAGNLWAGIGGYITRYDGVTWTNYPLTIDAPVKNTSDLVVDANNDVWVGAYGDTGPTGINLFSNGVWTNYTMEDGMLSNQIGDIAIDPTRNTLWFAMSYVGVTRLQQFYGLDESTFLPIMQKSN